MKWRSVLAIAAVVLLSAGDHALSQQTQTDPGTLTYRVQSQLVQIYLTVTEGTRRVMDLKASDFRIGEDGAPTEMERLDSGTVPLYVALLLDTSESMREALPTTQEAAVYFVESLRPSDRVTLIPFNSDIRTIPQLSDDRAPIVHAIRSTQARGGTKLYDSILFAMKYLSGKEGRKAIVVFSDGEDTARNASLNITLNAAARYGFPIYTIGAGAGVKRDTLKRILRQLSEINSGKTYVVDDPRDLRSAFEEVSSELRSAYVLNYYTQVPFDGRWHDIRISLPNLTGHRIHSRKGFYAKAGGSSSLFTDVGEAKKGAAGAGRQDADLPPVEKTAQIASAEIVKRSVEVRDLDFVPIAAVTPRGTPAAAQSKVPVFKVESRLVEVPVLLESTNAKEMPGLTEKDFRIYEDDSLREIIFFSRELSTQNISQLRENALKKVNSGKSNESPIALSRDTQELRLGRYYLILDDLMSEPSSFLTVKKYAEKIIRDYHTAFRPISLHFTSQSQADVYSEEGVEAMVSRVQKAMPRASRELTSNDNLMSVYEAYLIERGDTRATQLADLRYASSIFVHYRNALGEVEGHDGMSAEVIENTVLNNSRQLLSENFAQVSRTLDSLRAVVNAAAADTGDYPKTVLYMSSGFSVGRGSGRSDMAGMLDNIIAAAKRNRVRVFTVDATGLAVDESLGIGANMGFLVRNPHLSSILSDHARGWRIDRQSPLAQLAAETGGRFQHSNNDLAAPIASAVRTAGQLYYLGYLSKQPTDGRFHKIRVTTSLMAAKVYARKGYFAGRHNEPETLASTSMEGEDWETVLRRANDARKSGNMKELAASLEQLVRRFPNQGDFWYNLGAAHLNLGNPQRAVDALQRAFAISPDDMNVGLALSQAFVAAGYRGAASETLQTMCRRQPRHVGLLMQLGRVYESEARTREAYQTYRKILDLQLALPMDLYPLLARTSMRLGRRVEAGLFIQEYLARGGDTAEAQAWREMLSPNPP